jgi:hypothetical protein
MGIDTYLLVVFWMGVVGLVIRGIFLIVCSYPRKVESSLGADVLSFIIMAFFLGWISFLRFYS